MTDQKFGDIIPWTKDREMPVPGEEIIKGYYDDSPTHWTAAASGHIWSGPNRMIGYRRLVQPKTRTWYQSEGLLWTDPPKPFSRTITAELDDDGLFRRDTYVGQNTGAKIWVK